jgi:hypothetical protein
MTMQRTFDFLERAEAEVVPADFVPADSSAGEDTRAAVVDRLRAQLERLEGSTDRGAGTILSTGSRALDRLLPHGGLRADAITEWVSQAEGSGAAALAMIAAANHLHDSAGGPGSGGPLVVVGSFYPPAAVALGIAAERIVWVRPSGGAELVWAIDQSLRCESVAAVWAQVGADLDDRDARRFQLAAETGGTPGLLIRPAAVRGRPTFADVRLHVSHRHHSAGAGSRFGGRVLQVTLDRCRGGAAGGSVWVQIDDRARLHDFFPTPSAPISNHETAALRLASELADPATSAREPRRDRGASVRPGRKRA